MELSAFILNMVYDSDMIACHSEQDTWQRDFGYNNMYDDKFI